MASKPRAISLPSTLPLNQYADQYPPSTKLAGLIGPRSRYAISVGCSVSVKSKIDTPPWYQACTMMSRPGTGMIEPLWATQFSAVVCGAGSL